MNISSSQPKTPYFSGKVLGFDPDRTPRRPEVWLKRRGKPSLTVLSEQRQIRRTATRKKTLARILPQAGLAMILACMFQAHPPSEATKYGPVVDSILRDYPNNEIKQTPPHRQHELPDWLINLLGAGATLGVVIMATNLVISSSEKTRTPARNIKYRKS